MAFVRIQNLITNYANDCTNFLVIGDPPPRSTSPDEPL